MNIFEQGLLKYLSSDQLKKIQSVKVGIGGAGGLGSNVAMMLVRTGFIHLEILDFDCVEASNLNRQQYFIDEINQPKVDVLKKRLLQINPDLKLNTHQIKWSPEIGDQFFPEADFIIEAFDQVDWKYKFVEYYQDKVKYLVSGNGMAGLTKKEPLKIRRVGNIYLAGDGTTNSHEGHPPMAPRVTACAAMMAEIVLDLALEIPLRSIFREQIRT